MARPTWDELRPKVALLREAGERVEAAAREEERIRREPLRPAPPDWLYDPEGQRWTFRGYGWEAELSWLPPDDYHGGLWRLFARHQDGNRCLGGGLDGPREAAMQTAEEVLKKGTWRDV